MDRDNFEKLLCATQPRTGGPHGSATRRSFSHQPKPNISRRNPRQDLWNRVNTDVATFLGRAWMSLSTDERNNYEALLARPMRLFARAPDAPGVRVFASSQPEKERGHPPDFGLTGGPAIVHRQEAFLSHVLRRGWSSKEPGCPSKANNLAI